MRLNRREVDLIRASKCMTMRELAASARVSYASLCRTDKDIGVLTLGKIARALDVDPRQIILTDEPPQETTNDCA